MTSKFTSTINQLPDSHAEISGEIPHERFATYRARALKQVNQEVKLDGFRPGHIPEEALVAKLGEERILLTMAEFALQEAYPEMLREHALDAIGRPEITITKLAAGNPLGFKIKTALNPEFSLPNYQEIAKETNAEPAEKIEVTEKEIEEVITEVNKEKPREITPDLREKIKANLALEKERRNREKKRLKIIDAIIAKTEISLPPVLLETELDKMMDEMKHQIEQMGLKFADYLKHLKKEEQDLRDGWKSDAEKRLKTGLILTKIAKVEKLEADQTEVEKEVKHLQEHYKDAPEANLRRYITDLLLVEAVWRFLENQA